MKIYVVHTNYDYNECAAVFGAQKDARLNLLQQFEEGREEPFDRRLPWSALTQQISDAYEAGPWKGAEISVFSLVDGAWKQLPDEEDFDRDMIFDPEGAQKAIADARRTGAQIVMTGQHWEIAGRRDRYDSEVEAALAWLEDHDDDAGSEEAA